MNYKIYNENCLVQLDQMKENCIDSIVTDPPYELNFMGKGWDNAGVSFNKETWQKCLRVLKPGGYLLAFGGSRTFHRIAVAIEDAGFEIRDTIMWLYGSGFPKSMDIEKSLNKRDGVEFESKPASGVGFMNTNDDGYHNTIHQLEQIGESSERAKKWQGWGTALKPSFEPIIVARKPFKGSLVDNVIEYGVGGINIDECRVEFSKDEPDSRVGKKDIQKGASKNPFATGISDYDNTTYKANGRFPANTILTYDETDFDEVCGGFPYTKGSKPHARGGTNFGIGIENDNRKNDISSGFNDSGSASRYFMNCKYTGKDEEIWKQLLVNNVGNNLEILKATKDNIAQMNVEDLLKELKDHYAKYVANQQELIETSIVQDIVKILTWDFKIETSQVIQDFITNSKKCIQFLNLVQFVEKMDNIDTTQTTQNLLKLFGYVKVVITNYIQGNIEYDQKRYIYTPKASKKDRDEGLDEFEEKLYAQSNGSQTAIARGEEYNKDGIGLNQTKLRKNIHPTVKPTELMQYLVRLVTPNGGTVLDPFMGSGSTGKAVAYENQERNKDYKFIGIELNKEYCEIAKARINYAGGKNEEESI